MGVGAGGLFLSQRWAKQRAAPACGSPAAVQLTATAARPEPCTKPCPSHRPEPCVPFAPVVPVSSPVLATHSALSRCAHTERTLAGLAAPTPRRLSQLAARRIACQAVRSDKPTRAPLLLLPQGVRKRALAASQRVWSMLAASTRADVTRRSSAIPTTRYMHASFIAATPHPLRLLSRLSPRSGRQARTRIHAHAPSLSRKARLQSLPHVIGHCVPGRREGSFGPA